MADNSNKLAAPILQLEVTDDYTAATPTWTKVAHLADSIEISPNTEVADQNNFESCQLDKTTASEAWEQTFSKNVTTVEAGLQALGLLDSNYRMLGSVDTRTMSATAPAVRFTAYQNEQALRDGTVGWQLGCEDYLLAAGSAEINPDDYALSEYTLHYRVRPIRLDLGGQLGTGL